MLVVRALIGFRCAYAVASGQLNATEKLAIKWKLKPSARPTPHTLGTYEHGRGVYGSAYTLRWHEYGGDGGGRGGGGRMPVERMLKAPPWLFSAEADVYKTPSALRDKPDRFPGDRVVAREWGAHPRPTVRAGAADEAPATRRPPCAPASTASQPPQR